MDRRLLFPIFGNAPDDYLQSYHDDVARKLNLLAALLRSPGEGRNTTIVLTNLQSNDYGLEPGTLFSVNGAVRISLVYSPYLSGVEANGSVGTVTVTI